MKFLNLVIFGVALFIFCIYCFSSYSIFQTSFSQVSQQLEWSHGKDMPKPREEISGTVLNDEIYIVGGSADNNKITDNVDVYDPKTDQWKSVTSLPEPRDHIGLSSYNGKIYAVGGFDVKDRPSNELLVYNPQTKKMVIWSSYAHITWSVGS